MPQCAQPRSVKFQSSIAQASRFNSTTAPQVSSDRSSDRLRDAVDMETCCRPIPNIGLALWIIGAAALVVVTMMVIGT